MSSDPVLSVRDLSVEFRPGVRVVDSVSFTINRGEVLGLVGESGSGKSVTSMSVMGLLDPPGRVTSGSVQFEGKELVGMPDDRLRKLRGGRLAMVFQDPMSTLNPVLRIDTQMIETVLAHEKVSRAAARARCIEVLEKVGIPSPAERLLAYPHHFSGGMRQRVAIAIALLHSPALIIADEPTTALDVTIQAQILAEVQTLVRETGTAFLWVTHDLSVISGLADRVAVMYAGRIVEQGRVEDVLSAAGHPYTAGLLNSLPSRNQPGELLSYVPGNTPVPEQFPKGCVFAPRCAYATPVCATRPATTAFGPGHGADCHHPLQGPTV